MVESSDEVLHRISFGYQDSGLTGQGLGPVGTSFAEQDYPRVTTWRDRLSRVTAPQFPHEHAAPSYWYRRFADGQGALLRRTPEENSLDGRGSRAQALVGARLNAPRALLAALGLWPDLHAWLEEPGTTPPGWATVEPFTLFLSEVEKAAAQQLDLDAASQPGLVSLVAEVLRVPVGPVDLLGSGPGPSLEERERLLLLWGLYRTLRGVVGTEERPKREGFDWSFTTHEPWPVRRGAPSERPHIAFRPAPPRSQAEPPVLLDVLAPEQDTVYHVIARWLVTLLGADDGRLTELGRELRRLDAADHDEVIGYLARRAARSRVPGPLAPQGAGPRATRAGTVGSERAVAEEEVPGAADAEGSSIPAEDSGVAPVPADTARTDGPPARPLSLRGGERGRGAFRAAPPGTADRPGRAVPRAGERSREAARHRAPGQRPWSAPGQHPRTGSRAAPPDGYAPPAAGDAREAFPPPAAPSEARVQDLLDDLGREHDPHRIAAIATQLVRQYQPSFGQHLVVRGYPRKVELRTEMVLALVAGLALLIVLLLAANLLR